MENQIFGFQVSRQEDSGEQYLVLTLNRKDNEIIGYQVDMILNNHIPGLIPLFMKEMDAKAMLLYRITNFLSLDHYLRINRSSSADLLKILISILQRIHNSKIYLLSEDSFILDPGYIFIHPETAEIGVLYVPVDTNKAFSKEFQAFILSLIVQTPTLDASDPIIQKILNALRGKAFNISSFITQLKSIKEDHNKMGGLMNATEVTSHEQHYREMSQKIMAAAQETLESHQTNGSGFSWNDYKKAEQVYKTGDSDPENRRNLLTKLLPVMGVIALIIAALSLIPGVDDKVSLLLKSLELKYLITGIFLSAMLGVLVLYFKKKAPSAGPYPLPEPPHDFVAAALDTQMDETVVLSQNNDETTLLSVRIPLLKATGREETIIISKHEFVIGRSQELCDYAIKNKNIGRMHARITREGENHYLTDIDSKNGTFLNGVRLISHKAYKLNQEDLIVFATDEFKFLLN